MSDEDKIIKLLQEDGAPALGLDAAQRIAARAVVEFSQSRPRGSGFFSGFVHMPVLAAGFAALAVVCFLAWPSAQPDVVAGNSAERDRILLAQLGSMFDGKLQAVITSGGKTQIVLGDVAEQRGQPVVIRLTENGQSIDIVSFSGQNVQVSMGGRQVSFETLIDGKGGIILAGDSMLWSSDRPQVKDDLKIEARELEM